MDKQLPNRKPTNKDGKQDVTQMELNICNTNSNSLVVINDLELLTLIHLHPFLVCPAVRGFGEKDYEEWGWRQIAKRFNESYEGLQLNTPFTVEELQWRWEMLRPVCPLLGKACGKIPEKLWFTVSKINKLLATKPRVIVKPMTNAQQFMLNQLPVMERLTPAQRQSLEAEVLDAIFTQERNFYLEPLNKRAQTIVQSQYEDFLKTIGIKELATSTSTSSKANTNTTPAAVTIKTYPANKRKAANDANPSSSKHIRLIDNNFVTIAGQEALSKQPDQTSITLPDIKKEDYSFEAEEPLIIEAGTSSSDEQKLRYVPLESVKYYTKKVRVRIKRLNLKNHQTLTRINELH
ncbi:uncharacterized protein LOC133845212 [Drosophila sulfurigaster albostrigata]|uniref:uncharacterized protein LOC133845212 n=1 Tax=Drosophila sulfurigaster albostrigata TaxID=89887 RepID=UPI002D2184A8|nr:uncharacterized protein LOC133845212 [Drosophila sulfurigaster albostrigata]